MADTRARILETARKLFNEQGVHRVGVRDVARALDMSPGNLAYHFPTKDELVTALVMELHRANAAAHFDALPESFTLLGLYAAAVGVMRKMVDYRFIIVSYVDAVKSSKELSAFEAKLSKKRRSRIDAMMERLMDGGLIDRKLYEPRADRINEQSQFISSGWLSMAELTRPSWSTEKAILHYAKLGMALLEGVCTERGKRELERILDGAFDRSV